MVSVLVVVVDSVLVSYSSGNGPSKIVIPTSESSMAVEPDTMFSEGGVVEEFISVVVVVSSVVVYAGVVSSVVVSVSEEDDSVVLVVVVLVIIYDDPPSPVSSAAGWLVWVTTTGSSPIPSSPVIPAAVRMASLSDSGISAVACRSSEATLTSKLRLISALLPPQPWQSFSLTAWV